MNQVRTRVIVSADHRITGTVPEDVPAGEHEAIITVAVPTPRGKKFTMENFPSHDTGWDGSISLRREDMYDDDGR